MNGSGGTCINSTADTCGEAEDGMVCDVDFGVVTESYISMDFSLDIAVCGGDASEEVSVEVAGCSTYVEVADCVFELA